MSRLLKVALLVVAGALLYVAVPLFWPTDMAVHPATRNVFLSVARNGLTGGTPAVFRVDGAGAITLVSLEQVSFSRRHRRAARRCMC